MKRLKKLTIWLSIAVMFIVALSVGMFPFFDKEEAPVTPGYVAPAQQYTEVPAGYTAIRSEADFEKMRTNLGGKFVLMNDIKLNRSVSQYEGRYWNQTGKLSFFRPIGSTLVCEEELVFPEFQRKQVPKYVDGRSFTGTFDGNGYTVTYDLIPGGVGSNWGLFGIIGTNGTVRDLRVNVTNYLENYTEPAVNSNLSDVVLKVGAIAGINNGYINNCEVNMNINLDHKSYYVAAKLGGVAGINTYTSGANSAKIENCTFNLVESGGKDIPTNRLFYFGGMAGQNQGGRIESCVSNMKFANSSLNIYNSTVLDSNLNQAIGGLVGYTEANSSNVIGKFNNNVVNANIKFDEANEIEVKRLISVGGAVGYAKNIDIENTAVIGDIYVSEKGTGGGSTHDNAVDVGGLIGCTMTSAMVKKCDAVVNVTALTPEGRNKADTSAGGLIGYMADTGTVSDSSASGKIYAKAAGQGGHVFAGGLIGRSTATVDKCTAKGEVYGEASKNGTYDQRLAVGGLLGDTYKGVSDSVANVSVKAYGHESGTKLTVFIGGLVGIISSATITGSNATGNVEAYNTDISDDKTDAKAAYNLYAGGLVGQMPRSAGISNSTATGDVKGCVKNAMMLGGLAGECGSYINNCTASGSVWGYTTQNSILADTTKNSRSVGGIVGRAYACNINNSTYDGAEVYIDVNHNNARSNANAGGIAGMAELVESIPVNITSCASFGTITAKAYYYARAGGLVGYSKSSGTMSSGTIQKSFFKGTTVSGTYDNTEESVSLSAGLVADADSTKISECMAEGTATVDGNDKKHRISGLVGYLSNSGSIKNSYSVTELKTNGATNVNIGGVVGGVQDGARVDYSYFAGTSDKAGTNGICGHGDGNGNNYIKESANLVNTNGGTIQDSAVLDGFDFDNTWIDSGSFADEWPTLRAITDTRTSNKTDSFEVREFKTSTDEIYHYDGNIKGNQGNFGIDKFGIVYRLNNTDNTASVMGLSKDKYDDALSKWNAGNGTNLTITLRNKVYLKDGDSTTSYTITSIEADSFEMCIFLSDINIPDMVHTIGKEAFKNCASFTKFVSGAGVLRIEDSAFYGCAKLQSVNLNTALTHIGANAFHSCSTLKNITFGTAVKSIGNNAFDSCLTLRSANFLGDRPENMGSGVFLSIASKFIINYSTTAKNWDTVNAYHNGASGIPSGWKINYRKDSGDTNLIPVYMYGMVRMLSAVEDVEDVYEDDLGVIYKITKSSATVISNVTVGTSTGYGSAIKEGVTPTTVSIPQRVMVDGFNGEHDVKEVAQNAFRNIESIKQISLQKNISSINNGAFMGCTALEEVYFYGDKPSVGGNLFDSGATVRVVYFLGTKEWGDTFNGISLYSAAELNDMRDSQGILYTVFDRDDIYTATVGTASGGENRTNSASYYGASGEVIIPEYIFTSNTMYRVTELDRYAFLNNRYIKTLELGRNINTIGDMSLRNTENLKYIKVHEDNPYYGAEKGILCSKVTITSDNQSDYPYEHERDYAVGSVLFARIIKAPEKLTVSNGLLMLYDTSWETISGSGDVYVSYPLNHVVIIDNYAFAGNKTIATITAGRIGVIGDSAFENAAISSIEFQLQDGTVGNSLKRIGNNAFYNCTNLTAFNITANVNEIGEGAFALCSGITGFTVADHNYYFESHGETGGQGGVLFRTIRKEDGPDAGTKIGLELMQYPAGFSGRTYYKISELETDVISVKAQAFASAKYLTEIVIGDTVEKIASGAFTDCINLRYVHIGASVNELGAYVFDRCFNLTEIFVNGTNKFFMAKDGVLYNYDQTLLIAYTAGSQRISFTVPDTVVEIEPFAFAGSRALLRVIVPATVVTVGESAFYNANRLQSVYFKGDAPTDMGKYLFDGVSKDFVVYRREFAEGWSMSFAGFPVKIYNAINEIGNDVAKESMYILAVVDSYGAPHSGFKVVFDGAIGNTDANGFVTFSFDPQSTDTVSISITDPENAFYPFSNSEFILDKEISMSYITMIDRPWVMGVSVSGSSAPAKDINSQVAMVNVSTDYEVDDKHAYKDITITVEGYIASIYYIKEYALVQNGEKIISDIGPGGDGFVKGKYTFSNIDHNRFTHEVPIQVLMLVGAINSQDNATVEELLIDLNINLFCLDNPVMPQFSPGSAVKTDSSVPFIGGLDFDFSMGSVNFSFAMDNETVKIGLGIEAKNKDNKQELMDAVKELMDKWKGAKSAPVDTGPVDVEVEFKIAGYLILAYSPNGLQFRAVEIYGYCAITVSYEHSLTEQIGIPITIEVEIGVEAEILLRIGYDESGEEKAGMYFEDLVASLDVKLTVRAGIGCMVFSVGIYGRLGAFIKVQFIPKVQLLKLSVFGELGLYMKVGIGPFKITKEFSLLQATYIWVSDDPKDKLGFDVYTPFAINQLMSAMTVQDVYGISVSGEMTLSDIESRGVKMFEFGEDRIMVYYDDVYANANGYYDNTVGSYDEYNFLKLVYSVYDKTNGKWGNPVIFDDNGKNDGEYNLTTTAEGVYLAYTQATKTITEQTQLDEYLASLEVKTSLYTASGFGSKLSVGANNNIVDINPKVSKLADGSVYVAWFTNSDNNMFGLNSSLSSVIEGTVDAQETTANSLWYSKLSGGVWGEPILIKDKLHTMIDYEMNGGIIYYILDEDCNLETPDDKSIYMANLNGSTITNTLVLGNDKKDAYADISYFGGQFVYTLNGNLYTIDGDDKLFENDLADFSGNYAVASEGGTVRAIVYAGTVVYPSTDADADDEYGMGLYALYFDGAAYGSPILLKDFGANSYIDKFETYYNNDGLNVACIITHNSSDGTFYNTFFEGSFKPQGISVDGFSVPSADIIYRDNGATASATATMTLTNNGYTAISSVKAEVFDKDNRSVYVNENVIFNSIASGKSGQISLDFEVSNLNSGSYTMVISLGETQSSFAFTLLYSDLQISSKHVVIGGINYLLVSVYNASPFTTSATLYALGSYEENVLDNIAPETKAIYSLEIGAMKSGERRFFTVELDELFYKSDATVMGGAVTMYIKSSLTDGKAYNNFTTVSVNEVSNTGGSADAIAKNPFVYIESDRFSKRTDGNNAIYNKDIKIEITLNGNEFAGIDGLTEDEEYEVEDNGATITITMFKEYLETLRDARHSFTLLFEDSVARSFSILVYGESVIVHTVSWDVNGAVTNESYLDGDIPQYTGVMPQKAPDDSFTYEFSHWADDEGNVIEEFSELNESVTYYAVFTKTAIYTLIVVDELGDVKYDITATEGDVYSNYLFSGIAPNGYIFSHWSKTKNGSAINESDEITASHTLYAVYALTSFSTLNASSDIDKTYDATGSISVDPKHPAADATFTYKWYKLNGSEYVEIEGETSQSLSVINVSDSGSYKAAITAHANGLTKTEEAFFTVTIAKEALAITADMVSMVYGDSQPALTYRIISGTLFGGNALTGELERESGNNVGTYGILLGTLSAGDNYVITYLGAVFTINKAAASAPTSADMATEKTANSITVSGTGLEFSINGGAWQTNGEFLGLLSNTPYTVSVRYKETENFLASEVHNFVITTDKGAQGKIDTVSIKQAGADFVILSEITGAEYSMDGETWQDSNVFTGLDAKTKYTFYARYKETGTQIYGASSDALEVSTKKTGLSSGATAVITVAVIVVILAVAFSVVWFGIKKKTFSDLFKK